MARASFADLPIRQKLVRAGLLMTGIALATYVLLVLAWNTMDWSARMVSEAQAFAAITATDVASAVIFDDREQVARALENLREVPSVVGAAVYDAGGALLADYRRGDHGPELSATRPPPDRYSFTLRRLVVTKSIVFKGSVVGQVVLGCDLRGMYTALFTEVGLFVLIALGSLLLARFLSANLQGAIVRPVLDLAGVMRSVSASKDYGRRATIFGEDEIGMLARAFNEMLEGIQARDRELAAHRGNLEVQVAQRTRDFEQANARLQQEVVEHARAEAEVRQLNEALEARVEQRTRQLTEAQDALVRREKLAVLGQVAGSVGHELRNPLGVISNAVYFLKSVLTGADPTTLEYLDMISDEIGVADRIVGDLLDSVRTKPPHPQSLTVAEIVEPSLRKCVVPQNVSVRVAIDRALPRARVDGMQVQQVFRNLISNAVEAMPRGGVLELRAEAADDGRTLRVRVTDTGTGIAPEVRDRLFQPLFTTKARGIGLGLVVVRNLTTANGGSVEVESVVGQGTTFTVTLPCEEPKGEAV